MNAPVNIGVPAVGEPELPQEKLTERALKQALGGLLIPSQGFSKAMARRILNLEAGRAPGDPVPL